MTAHDMGEHGNGDLLALLQPMLVRPPRFQKGRSRIQRLLGFYLVLVAALLAVLAYPGASILIVAPVCVGIAIVGNLIGRQGRRRRASANNVALLRDGRPPVLYLRSFDSDKVAARLVPGTGLDRVSFWFTEEEMLASVLRQVGPFIAIGRPGERLPQSGAFRLYVSDDTWRAVVSMLTLSAALVIVRVGVSEGLRWEAGDALSRLAPERLALLVPNRPGVYESFRRLETERFPGGLPKLRVGERHHAFDAAGIVSFDRQWQPRFTPVKLPRWGLPHSRHAAVGISAALRPVIDRLGVRPRRFRPGGRWYGLAVSARAFFWLIVVVTLATAASNQPISK